MPDKKPYFTVKVTRCEQCPYERHAYCTLEKYEPYKRFLENVRGITPSCPMWAQRVQQQEKKV